MTQRSYRIPKPALFPNEPPSQNWQNQSADTESTDTLSTIDTTPTPTPSPTTTTSIFSLPLEIRLRIYILVIRPDCRLEHYGEYHRFIKEHAHVLPERLIGCMSILRVCSQMYSECSPIIQRFADGVTLSCNGKYDHLFKRRSEEDKRSGGNYSKKSFDALMVVRMKKISLNVQFGHEDISRTAENVREVCGVIEKSRCLEMVRVRIEGLVPSTGHKRREDWYIGCDQQGAMGETLKPIVNAVTIRGCQLLVEDTSLQADVVDVPWRKDIQEEGALVQWFVERARHFGVCVRHATDVEEAENAWTGRSAKRKPEIVQQGEYDTKAIARPRAKEAITFSRPKDVPEVLEAELRYVPTSIKAYELTAECRWCHDVFREWSDLRDHLVTVPEHMQRFEEPR